MYNIFEELEEKVIDWAHIKGILGDLVGDHDLRERKLKQLGKFEEESVEFMEAVYSKDIDKVRDELGDVLVTLTVQANLWGLSLTECMDEAYNKIAVRTGRMVDGVFVKDE
jgi:NTP pyrophosphatase (non-canonical NTP hydrolase)